MSVNEEERERERERESVMSVNEEQRERESMVVRQKEIVCVCVYVSEHQEVRVTCSLVSLSTYSDNNVWRVCVALPPSCHSYTPA